MKTDDVTILGYGPSNGDEDDEAAYIVKYQAILPNGHTRNDTIAVSELSDEPAVYKRIMRERYNRDPKIVLQELRRRYARHGNKVRILGLKIAIYGKIEDDGVIIYEMMSKCGNRKGRISMNSLFKRK